ncbi:homogentisate 1,2-dioxygenase domain-containing protein [Microtetraspora sp. NBRC 16547]|uniref:homogentisate 1,2-dioxygenase n=1 Tax=Microtetraspora sp. NBRC 16547 TaxID=3030993 RepID=UPI0024A181C4|nr:homogentisate 1,2-dioxygenase domain-containing protein [Microtetraspora sp. NBRC 16547]GLW97490.1 homogentisate 1,2-dioxygenase [Microtetraspora sp. NBRC 16547]
MPYYRVVGDVPRKRHVQFRRPDGGLYAEELMGEEGFSSDSSLLYHRHLPTAIVKAEAVDLAAPGLTPNLPLSPRHFRTPDLASRGDLVTGRQVLAGNSDVRISYVATDTASDLYRNSMGDECVYIASGRARFESTYGVLEAAEGDYVVIPTGTIHRWVPAGPLTALVVEAAGHIRPPRRYLSAYGQFLEHAPYCERDLRAPSEPLLVDGDEVQVLVRTRGGLTRLTYAHHPFDVVGWDGCLYPYAFNIHDFEPIVKRTHAPPPVHQTFEGPGFVICSFCPRPLDFHPDAVPIPYNHHNVDSDELMFYVGGDYTARRGSGIDIGSISLHPAGFTHGPQPGAVEAIVEAVRQGHSETSEMAVMIDTFRPLDLGSAALACEDPAYAWTWATTR